MCVSHGGIALKNKYWVLKSNVQSHKEIILLPFLFNVKEMKSGRLHGVGTAASCFLLKQLDNSFKGSLSVTQAGITDKGPIHLFVTDKAFFLYLIYNAKTYNASITFLEDILFCVDEGAKFSITVLFC